MKKSDNSSFTLILFLFGFIVIAALAFFLKDLFPFRTATYIFSCMSIILVYIAAFLPLLMGISGKTDNIVASGTVYYKGMAGYAVVSFADIFLAAAAIPLKAAIVIQLAALFIFIVYVFMARVTSDTISNVEENETAKKSMVFELRSKAQKLALMADKPNESSRSIKSAIDRINEDLRYLSPGSSSEAYELECKMSSMIDDMLSDAYFKSADMHSTETLEAKISSFELLYKQRKNIY